MPATTVAVYSLNTPAGDKYGGYTYTLDERDDDGSIDVFLDDPDGNSPEHLETFGDAADLNYEEVLAKLDALIAERNLPARGEAVVGPFL